MIYIPQNKRDFNSLIRERTISNRNGILSSTFSGGDKSN